MASSGIELATFRLVAQCLNYRVPRNKSSSSSTQEKRAKNILRYPFYEFAAVVSGPFAYFPDLPVRVDG